MAGLYVHVPFRRARRSYDEAYYVVTDESDFSGYARALCQELQYYAREYASEESITTIYAGGGRPSLLPLDTAHTLLTSVLEVFDGSAIEEATAEINPADAELRYLNGLRRVGFDRFSIEVLSFFAEDLAEIDAPHSVSDVEQTLQYARQVGFENLSVDLLFGWPRQSFENWKASLQKAVELEIPHITVLETPTSEDEHRPRVERAKRLEFAMSYLLDEGYEQYELTHFARPGYRSVHQENYYTHGNHLGLGPAAQTFWWTDREDNPLARRWSNVSDIERYVDLLDNRHPPIAYRQTLNQTALAREYVLLRLRTQEGLNLDVLENSYGRDLRTSHEDLLTHLADEGLIHDDNATHVCLTPEGRLVADGITERLLPE